MKSYHLLFMLLLLSGCNNDSSDSTTEESNPIETPDIESPEMPTDITEVDFEVIQEVEEELIVSSSEPVALQNGQSIIIRE
ncbi:hypothetical protein N9R79_05760 [Vibrio sp.]|nr:hypothetical protein [Vibrio sp.]